MAPQPAVPAAEPRPDRSAPETEAEPLTPARYRRNPAPDYPPEARRRREEGVVLLRVTVDARGRVETAEVAQSSGSDLLDEAARKAVRRWEFEPARRGRKAVPSTVTVPVRFRLEP